MVMVKSKFFDARQVLVLVCFVSLFYRVSCVLVNVTRKKLDVFAYPVVGVHCWSDVNIKTACKKGNAHISGKNGCICECDHDKSTFLKSELSCFNNWNMRNKSNTWTFLLLNETKNVRTPVGVLKLTSNVTIIKIKMNPLVITSRINANSCQPYRVEIRGQNGSWTLVNQILKMKLLNTSISYSNTISSNLRLQWKAGVTTAHPFAGEIMRIRINCSTVDDFIIFKVAGTFQVEIPEIPSESSFVTPTLSSSPLVNSTVSSTTQVFSITPSSYQHHPIRTSPSAIYRSTRLLITSSITIVSSDSSQKQSSEMATILLFSSISPTITSSSVNSSSPDQINSKDSSNTKVIIGAVIGVILALIIVVIIVLYILRKKKQNINMSGIMPDSEQAAFKNAMANKNFPLPTLANPVCDLVYYNPENVHETSKKRKSGVKSIDNADYDQCIVVENPSARNGVASVYDNIAPQQSEEELTYHALDPAKRENSNKYQSLVHPENEYSTIHDGAGSSSLQEPVYSVVEDEPHKNSTSDNEPKPDPVYNILEANDSSLQPVAEPVYNVIEQSNEIQAKQEPVYSVLEDK